MSAPKIIIKITEPNKAKVIIKPADSVLSEQYRNEALEFRNQAAGFASQTHADAVQTALDRVQTGLDVIDTNQAKLDAEAAALAAEVAKIEWRGDWGAGTYQANDAVGHLGSSWIANKTTTEEPSLIASDWDLLAKEGNQGSDYFANIEDFGAVGDGNSDNESINNQAFQSAVDSLPNSGGIVLIPNGIFVCSYVVTKNNVTIKGNRNSILKTPNNALPNDNDCPLRIAANYCVVQSISINGNAENNQQLLQNQQLTRYADGIAIYSDNVIIENCKIENVIGHGIIVWDEPFKNIVSAGARQNIIISNNFVKVEGLRSCIDVASTGSSEISFNIFINKNILIGTNDINNINDHGLTFHTAQKVYATDNIIKNCARGLNIHTNSLECYIVGGGVENCRVNSRIESNCLNITVKNFQIFDNNFDVDGDNSTIDNCFFKNSTIIFRGKLSSLNNSNLENSFLSFTANGGSVLGNKFFNITSPYALVTSTNSNLDILISNNIFENSENGFINILNTSRVSIINNKFLKSATVTNTSGPIVISQSNNILISNNYFFDSSASMIRITTGSLIFISNNYFESYRLTGIDSNPSTNTDIVNNKFTGTTQSNGRAILVRSSSSNINVKGNFMTGQDARIEVTGTTATNIVLDNNYLSSINIASGLLAQTRTLRNIGYVTENSGSATITSLNTSVVVNHGINRLPSLSNISITPQNSLGNSSKFWISNVTTTQFTINVDVSPSSIDAIFSWKVIIT